MKIYPLLLALLLLPSVARAHAVSHSYLDLTATPEQLSGTWRVGLRDLDAALGLDVDADGHVSDAELAERSEAITSYLLARLELAASARSCEIEASELALSGAHLVLSLRSACEKPVLSLRYDLFFDHDRAHRGHLAVKGSSEIQHVFTNEARTLTIQPGPAPVFSAFAEYLSQGIWHILVGADHVLFLLTLLTGAVLRFERGRYEPVPSLRAGLYGVVKVVTAFTAAHSITLSLMALGFVAPPSRWVEAAIALSIVAAAANNLWPVVTRRTWVLALAFGLVHGLGFASVLLELGLPEERVLLALLGFNLGVEAGQLGIVALLFPVAFTLRRRSGYRRYAFGAGSALVGVIGLLWSLERVLEVEWSASLWRAAEAKVRAELEAASSRPCALAALAEPGSYELLPSDDSAASGAQRRAFELACAGDLKAAAQLYRQALNAEISAAPPAALAAAAYGAAEVEYALGRYDSAEELMIRAIELWREQKAERRLANALARLGEHMALRARWPEAYLHYDEARRLHEATGATAALARDLTRLGDALVSAADPVGAKVLYERSRAAYEQAGDLAGVAGQYRNLAIVARLGGDTALSAQMYRRAIELHERQGHEPDLANDKAALARVYLGTQQYDEAKLLYEQANRIEERLGRTRALAKNYNQLGNLHQLRGELALAEQMYREALRQSERAEDDAEAANHWANLAAVYHKRGELEQARRTYERSLALFEQNGAAAKASRVRGLLTRLDRPRQAAAAP